MALGFTCGPEAAIAEFPCMNSIPDKAILAVIAVTLYYMVSLRQDSGDANDIAACDPCWNNLNHHEKLVALANILLSYAVESSSMTETQAVAAQSVSCLLEKSEEELYSIILCYICQFMNNIVVGPV